MPTRFEPREVFRVRRCRSPADHQAVARDQGAPGASLVESVVSKVRRFAVCWTPIIVERSFQARRSSSAGVVDFDQDVHAKARFAASLEINSGGIVEGCHDDQDAVGGRVRGLPTT